MKKFRQFSVGDVVIRKDKDFLIFENSSDPKSLRNVLLTMLAVSYELKWLPVTKVQTKPVKVGYSKSGYKIYIDNHDAIFGMHNQFGEYMTHRVHLTKRQIQGLVVAICNSKKDACELIQIYDLNLVRDLLRVEKRENYIVFEEEDYKISDELFIQFIQKNCTKIGTYHFDEEMLRAETKIPNTQILWEYLYDRFVGYTFNEFLSISSVFLHEGTVEFEMENSFTL